LFSEHLFSNERSVEIEGKHINLNPKQTMLLRKLTRWIY